MKLFGAMPEEMPAQALKLVRDFADQGLFVGELIAQLINQTVGFDSPLRKQPSGFCHARNYSLLEGLSHYVWTISCSSNPRQQRR